MKNLLKNNDGIALVTTLMLTMISLTMVMYLMLMVTSSIKQSGANRRYRSAIEAAYAMPDILTKEILPTIFDNTISAGGTTPGTVAKSKLFPSDPNFTTGTDPCILEKMTSPQSKWSAGCSSSNDAKESPDFTLKLNSTSSEPFTAYAKIVSTQCSDTRPYAVGGRCTNSCLASDCGSLDSDGIGVVVMSMPAIYRIEIRAERSTNPQEKAQISLLYAY